MSADAIFSANFRAETARQQTNHATVARAIGMDPRQLRRRARGEVGWALAEAEAVAQQLGTDVATLLPTPITPGSDKPEEQEIDMLILDPARQELTTAETAAKIAVQNNRPVPPRIVSTLLAGLDRLHVIEQRAGETSEDTGHELASATGLYILTGQERPPGDMNR